MADSVNELILTERKILIVNIHEQQGISMGITNKIVHDLLSFFKVTYVWVPEMLMLECSYGFLGTLVNIYLVSNMII